MAISKLEKGDLYRESLLESHIFNDTRDLETVEGFVGQNRAEQSIKTAINIKHKGFNVFVMGRTGTGRHLLAEDVLKKYYNPELNSKKFDYCYVNNFKEPQKPKYISLPAGEGAQFKKSMAELIETVKRVFREAFESAETKIQRKNIESEFNKKYDEGYSYLEKLSEQNGFRLGSSQEGFFFFPVDDKGEEITPEKFQNLEPAIKEDFRQRLILLQEALNSFLTSIESWRNQMNEKFLSLDKLIARKNLEPYIRQLKSYYRDNPKVVQYLSDVEDDIVTHYYDFIIRPNGIPEVRAWIYGENYKPNFKRYTVNLIVSHENSDGVNIVNELNPTLQNLVGRVEYLSQMGNLVTDFTLIKPGALHEANGGYLIVDARKLLMQPFAWEALKNALMSEKIKIESIQEMLSLNYTVTLEPEEIPLETKVILVGERFIYYLLYNYDIEFRELFKIVSDMEDEIERSFETEFLYARMISTIVKKLSIPPVSKSGILRIIEESARYSGDKDKLSIHLRTISDILKEAGYYAKVRNSEIITKEDIEQAIFQKETRVGRIKEKILENFINGVKLIDVSGYKKGQVNGLSVVGFGESYFGMPNRITANIKVGDGRIIDIEREVKFGGSIHSKGVLILSGLLGELLGKNNRMGVSLSLVFEQSYGGVDGDSASMAEFCAIVSAISEIPIKQNIAITGSINQKGDAQAIGGVNEKIEGFFEVCKLKGLNGEQGVLIPRSNVRHLMLKKEVIDAVRDGKFHIYSMENYEDALELLTDREVGRRGGNGKYPKGTIFYEAEKNIFRMNSKIDRTKKSKNREEGEGEF